MDSGKVWCALGGNTVLRKLVSEYLETFLAHLGANFKGRHIRAEILYRLTVCAERRTPEEVAQDYNLPVEAVHEAIDYARHSQELLEAERAHEEARMQQLGLHKPPFVPADTSTDA